MPNLTINRVKRYPKANKYTRVERQKIVYVTELDRYIHIWKKRRFPSFTLNKL